MEPIPTDALYDLATIEDLALSPDGERVAYVASEFDPADEERRRSVFLAPTDGSREPHRLTRASDAGSPVFSPDASRLAVVATRERDVELRVARSKRSDEEEDETGHDNGGETSKTADAEGDGDEEPEPQVWVFDLEWGGDARQVTDFEEGIEDFDWGPAGERLVVSARDPTDEQREYLDRREDGGPVEIERLQHKYDGSGWLDEVRTYLFVVDAGTRETERLDSTGLPPSVADTAGRQPAWGEGGIAFVGYDGEGPDDTYVRDVFVVDPETGERERVTDGDVMAGTPTWSSDGSRLAFRAADPTNWYRPADLRVADRRAGTTRVLSEGLDRTLGRGRPVWLDADTLLMAIGDEGWTRFVRFAVDVDPERVFTGQSRDESVQSFDAAGGSVVAVFARAERGRRLEAMPVAALDGAAAAADPRTGVADVTAALVEEFGGPRAERVRFDSGGQSVEGIAYHPMDFDPEDPDPRPLVLDIHGGPMAYDEPGWDFDAAFWTSRGYVVFRVNYRGSTSYGRAFSEALKGEWNALEVQDLEAGVDWMVEAGWADPERLFCTGFSQGGVNTAYMVTHTDRFAAAAAEHGVYDLYSSFGTDDSQNWLEADFGLPWENPEGYRASSSIGDVGEIATPLLVTAGGEDWRCPPTQAEQLYVSVRKRGVPARLVVYPDEHHAIGDPDRAVHRLEELRDWFERFDPAVEDEAGEE